MHAQLSSRTGLHFNLSLHLHLDCEPTVRALVRLHRCGKISYSVTTTVLFAVVYNLLHSGKIFTLESSSADFFQNYLFKKKSFRNTVRVSNSLDSDQDRHFVGPDLGSNCLLRLSADAKSCRH